MTDVNRTLEDVSHQQDGSSSGALSVCTDGEVAWPVLKMLHNKTGMLFCKFRQHDSVHTDKNSSASLGTSFHYSHWPDKIKTKRKKKTDFHRNKLLLE